ncbi:MAG: indolepyruvate ferredoxin oxidoreductase subunit alpha [Oscillospiraceae bacterium]|nr:indolepyruvate ferredoxin oxidoreductase subunit alpha [Oscillospiraceae bacterium]
MKERLMLGNEAVARGLYEANCAFVSSYPGTPSTEITEYAAEYDDIYAEWAPNEKVAAEAAYGASLAGVRAFSGMKHVGLNVAADPVFTASYTGVNAGLVIAVADDPGMHSSQNEQDSRHYARAAKLPMLEPADSLECRDYTKLAFELSERFDTPVFLRLSTRISHSRSAVAESPRDETAPARPYVKNPAKYVMVPANARRRHPLVERRMADMAVWSEGASVNRVICGKGSGIGVISSGIAFQTAREALGDNAAYLKLGMIHPLPDKLISDFAKTVDKLYIIEELDDVIESHCRALGIECQGKELFSFEGEYTVEAVRKAVLGVSAERGAAPKAADVPGRPPVLCPGCPHRGLFHVLNKMKLTVTGDIGCYTLGAAPPLSAMDLTLCMGASVSALHGFVKADPEAAKRTVGVLGDSTFAHSGLTGLMNIVYNQSNATLIILDNAITGMTGHQQNPTTGMTLKRRPTHSLDLAAVCRALGVGRVDVIDSHDIDAMEPLLREHLALDEPSVIIARRPCVLLPEIDRQAPLSANEKCKNCKACLRIGCPAVSAAGGSVSIDATQCFGCGLCARVCRFGALDKVKPGGEPS